MRLALLFVAAFALASCAQLAKFRHDPYEDEDPFASQTVGGRWPEAGYLSSDGNGQRALASDLDNQSSGSRSWVTSENIEAARRDQVRELDRGSEEEFVQTSGNTPVLEPATKRLYKNGSRATRADFIDESKNEGSLWASDGQTNYYFTKNKIRGVGDIVTVNLEGDFTRDIAQEVRRTLSPKERQAELDLAQERIRRKTLGLPDLDASVAKDQKDASVGPAPASAPAAGQVPAEKQVKPDENKEVPIATRADIDVSKSLQVKAGDAIMAEIVERYPNGNYKIRGTKKVPYKNGTPRLVNMFAIVRSTDIGEDDVVSSGKLYEYRLEAVR